MAPVMMAMSSSSALRRSPKPGAFIATQFSVPRSLFTTMVASASPSMSSAITTSGRRPPSTTFSKVGMMSLAELTFWSVIKISGPSRSTSIRWASVTKWGDRYPRSNRIPSTISKSSSMLLDSSTVITPSRPTLSIASAISSAMPSSWADNAATLATCSRFSTGIDIFSISDTTAFTALFIPDLRVMPLAPAATFLNPSCTMDLARTTEVVVPSPTTSLVLEAASFTI